MSFILNIEISNSRPAHFHQSKIDLIFHSILIFFSLLKPFSGRLIYATDKPFSIIVVKDLTPDGFYAPRQPPEEPEDSKLIIQQLAQFRAASFFFVETLNT